VSLIDRLRARDSAAVAEMFDRHAGVIERAVRGVLGPDSEVEDVTQDSFVGVLRGIENFRGDEAALGPWLRGIAVRVALKKLRWRRRRRWLSLLGSEFVPTLGCITDTKSQAALARAYTLLERLPPMQRAAFGLRFIEGFKLEEIADALGVSLATTKRHIRTARVQFEHLAGKDTLLSDWFEREVGQ
jgi:RNA polymerase sigma-70 factor (ECF subfamily)